MIMILIAYASILFIFLAFIIAVVIILLGVLANVLLLFYDDGNKSVRKHASQKRAKKYSSSQNGRIETFDEILDRLNYKK